MRSFIVILSFIFTSVAFASEVVESTTHPESVNPASITYHDSREMMNTSVYVTASATGGAWWSQQVYVSVGYIEEAQETFTIDNVMGEIIGVYYFDDADGNLVVSVIADLGSFDSENGFFKEGTTEYTLYISADEATDHGYSKRALLKKSSNNR